MNAEDILKLETLAESFLAQLLTTLGVPYGADAVKVIGSLIRQYVQSHYTAGPAMSTAELHTSVAAVGMGPIATMLIVKAAEYLLQLWLSRHRS